MTNKEKILQWCWDNSYERKENLFVRRLRSIGLNDKQILGVLKAINETCIHCWDAENGCQCWNDE